MSCKDHISLNPWKVHTDTAKHYQVYQILHGYSTKVYTKEEARERFNNIDISDIESYRDNVKEIIKSIILTDSKTSKKRGKRADNEA